MEPEDQLSKLNLTEEEMGRLTKAFKNEKFRKMLEDYAKEISDPENKKKYEEEITILERDRGNNVQFIHPTPFKCMRTSVDGKLKCYINVCANEQIGKPSCKSGQSEDGMSGHHWSLPHSLHPERKEVNPKGNKIHIYDVIFHPNTLHMASTNERFMDMVTNAAMESIQDAFNVRLDKKNIRTMSTKYKGSPQACVIRKPIPGFQAKDASDDPDPLAFPYPEIKTTVSKKEEPKNSQSQSEKLQHTHEQTKPHHIIKYRSFIDLQDFRCSRDSGKSPRPKEIVIVIDLPLLKSVAATTLEVKEKSLLLESQDPAYKLELSLAYAVDEDRGEAKFNTNTRQLVVTLPVQPSKEVFQTNCCPVEDCANDIQEEAVYEKDSEAERDESDSPETKVAENTGEIEEKEEKGDASEVRKESADTSLHQEGNDQKLDESHQDGTKMEVHERVTNDQMIERTMPNVQTCQVKEKLETELKALSKTQIRKDTIKSEKHPEVKNL